MKMNRHTFPFNVVSGLLAIVFALSPAGVFADTFSYAYSTPYVSYGSALSGCVTIANDLWEGSHGTNVLSLQQFLISRGYPGGGQWMATGYFGPATAAAVRNFQSASGLFATGYVDAQTRAAISRVSCGYSAPYTYGYTYPYPYTSASVCAVRYADGSCSAFGSATGAPVVTSINPSKGTAGKIVTIHGYGFSPTGNTVYFGNIVIANVTSLTGQSMSFEVPSFVSVGYWAQRITPGTYVISVTNASGLSSISESRYFTVE